VKTYRDGTPVQRNGEPVEAGSGPGAKATPQPVLAPQDLPEPTPEFGKDKAWRSGEKLQLGPKSGLSGASGALSDACVVVQIRAADLAAAAKALVEAGILAWVTVVTPRGPEAVALRLSVHGAAGPLGEAP